LPAVIDLIAQLITYVGGAIAALGFAWGVRHIHHTPLLMLVNACK